MELLKMKSNLERETNELLTSPSHNKGHLDRILSAALKLQKIYGGDPEIITAAVLLHDLGRVDSELVGLESTLRSVDLAKPILEKVDFPKEKIDLVCEAIGQHDQPEIIPRTIEGKILKEADFLDGFGARGIWRSLLWSGERGEGSEEILRRLVEKMPARIDSLIFPESKKFARKQHRFVELFLTLLDNPISLEKETLKGKYIIFEGISGSGKDTQALKLASEMQDRGIKYRIVHEPSPDTKQILREWRKGIDDPFMELLIFIADRKRLMEKEILPALRVGETVIGVRSFVSTDVYQTKDDLMLAQAAYLQTFITEPDLIFLIDIDEEEGLKRLGERKKKTGEEPGKFEKKGKLKHHREKYAKVLKKYRNVVKIDGMKSEKLVYEQVLFAIEQRDILE